MGQFTSPEDSPQAISRGLTVTWVGMAVNVLLAVAKLVGGILSGSQALIADGFHSLSDLSSDAIVLLGLKWGRKEEDAEHHYGHRRVETLSSMIVGMILLIVTGGIAWESVATLQRGTVSSPSVMALIIAGSSILAKEAMYWLTVGVARRLRSSALLANAWHHRSDALSSIAVFLGVGATYIEPSWSIADPLAALVVAFFVGRVGVRLIWEALRELSDTAPPTDVLERITAKAEEIDGVHDVHDLKARYAGPQILLELHIVVDPELTVRKGHTIADRVRDRLLEDETDVAYVIVHVDPEPD